jgi:uncharacterized protein YndB with AHSA1/START domain
MAEGVDFSEPVARTGMLIRRPVEQVFEAFVDPVQITHFWFTESSGRLETGATVTWTWEMYGASDEIAVIEVIENQRVEFRWSGPDEPNTVVWTFTPLDADRTFVEIVNHGFSGSGEQRTAAALDSMGGFCWVLAGAKAWLEHGIELNLVGDRFPAELGEH